MTQLDNKVFSPFTLCCFEDIKRTFYLYNQATKIDTKIFWQDGVPLTKPVYLLSNGYKWRRGTSSAGLWCHDNSLPRCKTIYRIRCCSLNRSIYSAICTGPLIETLYSMYTIKGIHVMMSAEAMEATNAEEESRSLRSWSSSLDLNWASLPHWSRSCVTCRCGEREELLYRRELN